MLTNVIAKRLLRVDGDPNKTVTVSIGQPEPDADPTGDWICSFHIDGIPDAGPHVVHGVDSLQALLLAIEATRLKIDASGLILVWHDDEPGHICIPRMIPYMFGAALAREMEQYVDARVDAWAKDASKRGTSG